MRNYTKKLIRRDFDLAFDKRHQEAKRGSVDDLSEKSSLRHGTMVHPSKTRSMKNAELNAYADVARNLMHDPSYADHGTMIRRNEFRRSFGDKTKFVTMNDGSEMHVSKVRARKRRNMDEEVIDVDVDPKDLNHYLPLDKRA